MVVAELPVFHYAEKLIAHGFVPIYTACHLLMALRCILYSQLPAQLPWVVLLIEPFHGVTFAAMWAASVEYGRREAPFGCRGRIQAIISGTYFQMSQALGSTLWGCVIDVVGFRSSYQICAASLLAWCLVWNLAVRCNGGSLLNSSSHKELCSEP